MSIADRSDFDLWSDDGYDIAHHWDWVADDGGSSPADLDGISINSLWPCTDHASMLDAEPTSGTWSRAVESDNWNDPAPTRVQHGEHAPPIAEWKEPGRHGYMTRNGWRQCQIHQGFWLCGPCTLERLTKGRCNLTPPPEGEEWKAPRLTADPEGEYGRFAQSREVDGHRLSLVLCPERKGRPRQWLLVHTEFLGHRPVHYTGANGAPRSYRAEDREVIAYQVVPTQWEGQLRMAEIEQQWQAEHERQTGGFGFTEQRDDYDPWDPMNRTLSAEGLAALAQDRADARAKVEATLARMGLA